MLIVDFVFTPRVAQQVSVLNDILLNFVCAENIVLQDPKNTDSFEQIVLILHRADERYVFWKLYDIV